MMDKQTTENKQLQTNLALEVLEQFLNLKARISVGIIYLDLQRFLGDIKVSIDKFERSPDSEVCPYLTELIKKIMFYHEFAFQCMEPTALLSSNNSGYNKEGLIMLGISLLTFGHGIGFMGIVGIIEGLIYLSKSNQDFARIYVAGTRGWF
jgi:hypothetical protein